MSFEELVSISPPASPTNKPQLHRQESATLTRLRSRQGQREVDLRQRLLGLTKSLSSDDDHDHDSVTESSFGAIETFLGSHNRNSESGIDLKWEKEFVHICFGLLTTSEEAPSVGEYEKISLKGDDLLSSIMKKVKHLSKAIFEQKNGNVVMKCQSPFVRSVSRDGTCACPFHIPCRC